MKRIFDPSFRYTPSYSTDLRKVFDRIRRELKTHDRGPAPSEKVAGENVLRLARKTGHT
jgi:hypothetical protein